MLAAVTAVVTADIILEISKAVISLFSLTIVTYFRQTLPVSRNSLPSQNIVVSLGVSFSGYLWLRAARTATKGLDAKRCLRMDTRSARECTLFTSAHSA